MSKTTASILCAFSMASPFLINILFSTPKPIPTIIAVGVAKPKAQGQAITKTDTALIIALSIFPEEKNHKRILEGIKKGKKLEPSTGKIMDLKILESISQEVSPSSDMAYQDALIIAMKAEKEAYILYTKLAEAAENEEIKTLLLQLAQEEAKHKLRFEMEYDEYVLKEN